MMKTLSKRWAFHNAQALACRCYLDKLYQQMGLLGNYVKARADLECPSLVQEQIGVIYLKYYRWMRSRAICNRSPSKVSSAVGRLAGSG